MRCDLCGRIEDDWRAIKAGWWSYYWITQGIRHEEPVYSGGAEEPILKDRRLIALGGDG